MFRADRVTNTYLNRGSISFLGRNFPSGSRLVFSASHQSLGFDFSWLNLFFAFGLLLRD
jgi:hypothetical protein